MLGLNKSRTLETITAYWYRYKDNQSNVQNWEETPKAFKCSYATSQDIDRISMNQGMPLLHMTVQTKSALHFKQNDKVVINGTALLIIQVIIENNPLSGMYTNKPVLVDKFLVLE